VQRLLLLEALQQPCARSLLAPALRSDWQQQQHLDLARTACGSSSSSDDSDLTLGGVKMPQLLTVQQQHAVAKDVHDTAAVVRTLKVLAAPDRIRTVKQQQQQQHTTGAFHSAVPVGCDDGSRAAEGAAAAAYMLSCLCDAGCRVSLACWVLTWHGCMLQQGGDYGSVQSR
jgi:hypothetical protein